MNLDELVERARSWFNPPVVPPPPGVEDAIARCQHDACEGVDDTPIGDPRKVWKCRDCGFVFRYLTKPGKPWFVKGYEPVQVIG